MVDHEEALTGGNVADEVLRVGHTVRKPATTATPAVAALGTAWTGSNAASCPH